MSKNKNKNKELEKHIENSEKAVENFVVPQVGSITEDLEKIFKHIEENFGAHKETGVGQAVNDLRPLFTRVIDLVKFIDESTTTKKKEA